MTSGKPVPVGVPVASSNQPANLAPTGARERIRATTATPSLRASSRLGRRGLALVRASLSARDVEVLHGVAQHRYLTTRQVEGFYFSDHATPLTGARVCRRVLRRLAYLRVLSHLDRRVGGIRAGSASYVWRVGPVGDRILRVDGAGVRKRQREPGRLFLEHCLAVADAHLALVRSHRADDLELVDVQCEPDCWRPFTGLGGARFVLQPDLYVVTGDPSDREFVNCWFIEIDRGTENPARLLAKCARYQDYRQTGIEQAASGSFPLVLWVMPDEARAEHLRSAIQRDGSFDVQLYRVTTIKRFVDVVRGGVT